MLIELQQASQRLSAALEGPGLGVARIRLRPHRHLARPGAKKWMEADVRPRLADLRFWNGFEFADEVSMQGMRRAVARIADEFGSLDACLAIVSDETRRRWADVAARFKSAEVDEQGAYAALVMRGLTAVACEARFRRGLRRKKMMTRLCRRVSVVKTEI